MSAQYRRWLAILAVGALLMIVGFALPWVQVSVMVAQTTQSMVKTSTMAGRELLPLSSMCAWVVLPSLAAVVATRSFGRQLIGVLIVLFSAAAGINAVRWALSPSGSIADIVRQDGHVELSWHGYPTWLLVAAGATIAAAAGVVTVLRGRTWSAMSSRYERIKPIASRSAWEALDHGDDPTV